MELYIILRVWCIEINLVLINFREVIVIVLDDCINVVIVKFEIMLWSGVLFYVDNNWCNVLLVVSFKLFVIIFIVSKNSFRLFNILFVSIIDFIMCFVL